MVRDLSVLTTGLNNPLNYILKLGVQKITKQQFIQEILNMMHFRRMEFIIAQFDGIPASGKSYLLDQIQSKLSLKYDIVNWPEPLATWCYSQNDEIDSIFDAFLKNPVENSYIFQALVFSTFLTEEVKIMDILKSKEHTDKPTLLVRERGIDSALHVFLPALQHVNWVELKLLKEFGEAIEKRLMKPHVRILLDSGIELSMKRLKSRGRKNEDYSLEYITKLYNNHQDLIKTWDPNTFITMTDNENLEPLIKKLDSVLKNQ